MDPAEQHAAIMLALGRIEQKIDSHLTEDTAVHKAHADAIAASHLRINRHDRYFARMKGGAAVIGGLAAIVSTAVLALPHFLIGG